MFCLDKVDCTEITAINKGGNALVNKEESLHWFNDVKIERIEAECLQTFYVVGDNFLKQQFLLSWMLTTFSSSAVVILQRVFLSF